MPSERMTKPQTLAVEAAVQSLAPKPVASVSGVVLVGEPERVHDVEGALKTRGRCSVDFFSERLDHDIGVCPLE